MAKDSSGVRAEGAGGPGIPNSETPILSRLRPPAGAVRGRRRRGRGLGSGLGKTGGKGMKGQKARHPGDFGTLEAPCPNCGGEVHENYKKFQCQACAFGFWKIMGGRQIEIPDADTLLRERRVGPLEGCRSRLGKPFGSRVSSLESFFDVSIDRTDILPILFSRPKKR